MTNSQEFNIQSLSERLRLVEQTDHQRGCQGRCYTCTCGWDDERDELIKESAVEIDRLELKLAEANAGYRDLLGELDRSEALSSSDQPAKGDGE